MSTAQRSGTVVQPMVRSRFFSVPYVYNERGEMHRSEPERWQKALEAFDFVSRVRANVSRRFGLGQLTEGACRVERMCVDSISCARLARVDLGVCFWLGWSTRTGLLAWSQ